MTDLNEGDIQFLKTFYKMFKEYLDLFEKVEIKETLRFTMEISALCNKYLQDNEPWVAKNIDNKRFNKNMINYKIIIFIDQILFWQLSLI